MELARDKKIVIPAGYKTYRYNIRYLLDTRYTVEERKVVRVELCLLLDIGENMLYKYLNVSKKHKKYILSFDKLQKLSTYFDCSIDALINESKP